MSRHLGQALFGLAKSGFELLQLLLSRADCVFPIACFSGAQACAELVRHTFPRSSLTSRRLPLSQTWSPGRQRSSAQWCCEAVSIVGCARTARQHLRFGTRARGPLGLLLLFRHVVGLEMRKGFEWWCCFCYYCYGFCSCLLARRRRAGDNGVGDKEAHAQRVSALGVRATLVV